MMEGWKQAAQLSYHGLKTLPSIIRVAVCNLSTFGNLQSFHTLFNGLDDCHPVNSSFCQVLQLTSLVLSCHNSGRNSLHHSVQSKPHVIDHCDFSGFGHFMGGSRNIIWPLYVRQAGPLASWLTLRLAGSFHGWQDPASQTGVGNQWISGSWIGRSCILI